MKKMVESVTDRESRRMSLVDDHELLALYEMEVRDKERLGEKEERRFLGLLAMTRAGKLSKESTKVQEARQKIIEGSLELVFGVAWWYRGRIDRKDLVGAGNIGLLEAVDKWRGRGSVSWYTHACHHIRWEMSKEVERSGHLHIPKRHDITLLNGLRKARRELENRREQLHPEKIIREALPQEQVGTAKWQRAWSLLSYDSPPFSAEELDWEKLWVCSKGEKVKDDWEIIEQWFRLAKLTVGTKGEAAVMSLLYGLTGDSCNFTYKDVGLAVGVTAQRVGKLFQLSKVKLRACVPVWANPYLEV